MISQRLHDLFENWMLGKTNAQVLIQDQTTRIFGGWAARELDSNQYALFADAAQFATSLQVTQPTNMVVGNWLFVLDVVSGVVMQCKILSVTPGVGFDTIGIDRPLDNTLLAASTEIYRITREMNVAGGSLASPLVYRFPHSVQSSYDVEIDITFMALQMTDADTMDDGKFGGIAALTNGIMLRVVYGNGGPDQYVTFGNVKTNSDIKHWGEFAYDDRSGGGGDYGFGGHVFFRDWYGGVLRLGHGDYIEVLLQDDLSGLTRCTFLFGGHFTND